MDINEIMEIILGLAHSQGFYGRLYNELVEIRDNEEEAWVEVVEELEGQNFKEPLDLILYFEQ